MEIVDHKAVLNLAAKRSSIPVIQIPAICWKQVIMSLVASGLVQQNEVRERIGQLQKLFVNDPEVARIDHRVAQDWSGDFSIFVDVVLKRTKPPASVIARLSEEIGDELLRLVRSEELGLHAYLNFLSQPEHG